MTMAGLLCVLMGCASETAAHRGGFPENSLTAFRAAAEQGLVLELDAQVLADGNVVVMHDVTVDRTTGSTGSVAGFTTGSWTALRLDNGEPAPFLADVLTIPGAHDLSIEAKTPGSMEAIIRQLDRHGLPREDVVLYSFILEEARVAERHGWSTGILGSVDIPSAVSEGFDWISPQYETVSGRFVRDAHLAGLRVSTWTVNDPISTDILRLMGVDAIISDHPKEVGQSSL